MSRPFERIRCPRCNQGLLSCLKIKAAELTIFACEECDAIWFSSDLIGKEPHLDLSTYLESLGLKNGWAEVEEAFLSVSSVDSVVNIENTFPLTLTDWREVFATRGPRGAAEVFLQKLATVSPDTQRAALCGMPTIPELYARFEHAWTMRDAALAGAPFLVKDLFAVAGVPTGCGSAFYAEVAPAPQSDASLVAYARESGAVSVGKTQLNEFAFGMTGENPHFGDCPHPSGNGLLAGGSSSGSAWAVGAGLVPWALATDTAGSIRVPASWCGVYGLRLVPGLTDADEMLPLSPSYDAPGWIAGTLEDLKTVTATLMGGLPDIGRPARVLWLGGYTNYANAGVLAGCERYASDAGWETSADAEKLFSEICAGVEKSYPVLGGAEAASVHRKLLEQYADRYDPVVRARLSAGAARTEIEVAMAVAHRSRIRDMFGEFFEHYDALAWPCVPCVAQTKAGHTEALRSELLRLNTPASLAGLPAISVPVAVPGTGLTAGIQIVSAGLDRLVFP